jgi:3-polyprenyl-4-hydroxybenzoate decarboxylase
VKSRSDVVYQPKDVGAVIWSGSFPTLGIIAPPVPASHTKPQSLEEMIDQTLARVLNLFDLEVPSAARYRETIGV